MHSILNNELQAKWIKCNKTSEALLEGEDGHASRDQTDIIIFMITVLISNDAAAAVLLFFFHSTKNTFFRRTIEFYVSLLRVM